jgi:hypothetical protein
MTLVAGLLVAWRQLAEPYGRQRQTMKLVRNLGGKFQTVEAAPWQRAILGDHLQDVTLVDLADCDEPDQYISQIAELPRLEALAIGGPNFTDEHLRKLRACKTLRVLVLDSTAVSANALAEWQRDHPQTLVYQSERLAIDALAEVGFSVGHGAGEAPAPVEREFGTFFCSRAFSVVAKRKSELGFPPWAVTGAVPLRNTPVDDEKLVVLRGLNRIEVLDLRHSNISDAGLAHVGAIRKLRVLYLNGTGISDAGLAHLSNLNDLIALELNNTRVSDAGLKHLRNLHRLATLSLDSTQITNAGFVELGHFSSLNSVFARGVGITHAAKDRLRAALPECFICIE